MTKKTLLITLPFLFALTGCQEQSTETNLTEKKVDSTEITAKNNKLKLATTLSVDEIRKQIDELTADKSCNDHNQCQAIAAGDRPCGGPSQYIIYSNANTDSKQLEGLAAQLTEAEKSHNALNNMASICQHLTKPYTQCAANQCVVSTTKATDVM